MDKALAEMVRQGLVSIEEAISRAYNTESLRQLLGMSAAGSRQAQLMG